MCTVARGPVAVARATWTVGFPGFAFAPLNVNPALTRACKVVPLAFALRDAVSDAGAPAESCTAPVIQWLVLSDGRCNRGFRSTQGDVLVVSLLLRLLAVGTPENLSLACSAMLGARGAL
eukprot:4571367-Pyramimonas_sp.AAC.1